MQLGWPEHPQNGHMYLFNITESHGMVGIEGTCGHHQEQPLAKAGTPRADCTDLCPDGF